MSLQEEKVLSQAEISAEVFLMQKIPRGLFQNVEQQVQEFVRKWGCAQIEQLQRGFYQQTKQTFWSLVSPQLKGEALKFASLCLGPRWDSYALLVNKALSRQLENSPETLVALITGLGAGEGRRVAAAFKNRFGGRDLASEVKQGASGMEFCGRLLERLARDSSGEAVKGRFNSVSVRESAAILNKATRGFGVDEGTFLDFLALGPAQPELFRQICEEYTRQTQENIVDRFKGEFRGLDLLAAQLVYWRAHSMQRFIQAAGQAGIDQQIAVLFRDKLVWQPAQLSAGFQAVAPWLAATQK